MKEGINGRIWSGVEVIDICSFFFSVSLLSPVSGAQRVKFITIYNLANGENPT